MTEPPFSPSRDAAPQVTAPQVTALRVTAFRNYASASVTIDAGAVVLVGPNGAGKTNLIEALSCLAPGRGLRRATTEALSQELGAQELGAQERGSLSSAPTAWAVSVDIGQGDDTVRVGVGQDPAHPSRRLVRIDGQSRTQSDLSSLVRIAWLTPAQDRVFAGPRGERMRFFDRLVLALHPEHGAHAARYERALRERSKLLEQGRPDGHWLDGLEAEMAIRGAAMARARQATCAALQAAIDARPDGAFPKADLHVDGWLEAQAAAVVRASADTDPDPDLPVALADAFQAELAATRGRDARAGRALTGPHRSDLVAVHRAKAMPAGQCSTGEQKALLVGLALAHARALEVMRARARPILLLDEAVAHLDADRRAALAQELSALGAQTWLTGTDAALFSAFETAQILHVDAGSVRSE